MTSGMSRIGWSLVVLLSGALIFGCASKNDSPDLSTISGISLFCGVNANNTSANLLGTWTEPCAAWEYSGSSPMSWLTDTLVFSGSTVTETVGIYDDAACDGAGAQYSTAVTSTFNVGGTASMGGGNDITFTISSVKVTPQTVAQASSWNSSSYCGISSWANGTATDVTGINVGLCVFPSAGAVMDQVFGLGNQSGGNLSCSTPIDGAAFGYGSNGSATSGVVLGGGSGSYPSSWLGVIFN